MLMIKQTSASKPAHGSGSANGSKAPPRPDIANAAARLQGKKPDASPDAHDALSASVQVLPLPAGLYLFSVKSTAAAPAATRGPLTLPAMHVGLGPGVRSEQVEFIAGPSTHGSWLFTAGDLLVTKISGAGATMVLTSIRAPGSEVLSISVERLDVRADAEGAAPASNEAQPAIAKSGPRGSAQAASAKPPLMAADPKLPLAVEIGAHIRTRGDMKFSNAAWAGRVGPGLWIESFCVKPLELLGANDIEYKGLTGTGFETPWLSEGKMCGTKGMATPLVGFALRLKPGRSGADYDCEYSGYFQSGIVVGPLRNGAPCRSSVSSDPLEGIQVRLIRRPAPVRAKAPPKERGSAARLGRRA
jgi:hypothetical protein